jgi:hypothetical protein
VSISGLSLRQLRRYLSNDIYLLSFCSKGRKTEKLSVYMNVPRGTQRQISLQKNFPKGLKAFSLLFLVLLATNYKKYISFSGQIYISTKERVSQNVLQRVYNVLLSDHKFNKSGNGGNNLCF